MASNYEQLVDALRCGDAWNCKKGCYYRGEEMAMYWCESGKMRADAADAIEALQAQLPNLGEWEPAKNGIDNCSMYKCSVCGSLWYGVGGYNYCPNCGADMRKMEVQDGQ